jgi:hypothetical protein
VAEVTFTLVDGDSGQVVGTPATYPVAAYSNRQLNRIFDSLGAGSSGNAYALVEVTGGDGHVTAYASVVDNLTGDAILVPGAHPAQAPGVMIPITAKQGGQVGTNWVSDVRVLNSGTSPQSVTIEYRPQGGGGATQQTTTVDIAPGQVHAIDDVLGSLFGLDGSSGSLRLIPADDSQPMLATSRTYNDTGQGTYGQFIPAVVDGFSGPGHVSVLHLDRNPSYRTNIGLCEVAGAEVEVRYALYSPTGSNLGDAIVSLAPYEVRQINDVYLHLGAADRDNTHVELWMLSGSGEYTAYASVVDNVSGDAIYVPALPTD